MNPPLTPPRRGTGADERSLPSWEGSGVGRFMENPFSFFRMHWDHEPISFGPRAVPARSGRAKTRAWVIFQGCWCGPRAATGDRSRSATSPRPTDGQEQVQGERALFRLAHALGP